MPVNSTSGDAPRKRIARGIYLIPNLFTLAAMFAGFYTIIMATQSRWEAACVAIFVAMIFDGLDGRVARLMQSQSAFGAELDSLSDMASFGLAPAMLLYFWGFQYLGKPGWLVSFVVSACTALRLARFNSQAENDDKRYFRGLSSPLGAGVLASFVWSCVAFDLTGKAVYIIALVLALVVALLMVSSLQYRSFKDIDMKSKVPFMVLLLALFFFVLVTYDPPRVLLVCFGGYAISGPVGYLLRWRRSGRQLKKKV